MRFNRDFPKIELAVNIGSLGDIIEQVVSDVTHIGIVHNPPMSPAIRSYFGVDVKLKLHVSRDHELAQVKGPVSVARALSYPLAKMPNILGLGRTTELLASAERIPLNVILSSNPVRSTAHFIRNGTAVTILGARFALADDVEGELVVVDVEHPLLSDSHAAVIARSDRTLTRAMTTLPDYIGHHSAIFRCM